MNDAGKISFLPKGEYDSGAMYEALDVVKYDGMVWAAKKSSKGITPAEGENWMCLLTAADYATEDAPGIVKPDGDTIEVSTDATISVSSKALTFSDHDTAISGTSFTDAEDGNMLVTNATRNLSNPTLATTTQDGVTCTNNGDGTYTLNGTSTKDRWISFGYTTLNPGKYKFIATEDNVEVSNLCVASHSNTIAIPGSKFTIQSKSALDIGLSTQNNTFNNVLIKPMITTDLDATYDDFVPYGGYDIKTCGKNLLNLTKITTNNTGTTASLSNGIITLDGSVDTSGGWKDIYFGTPEQCVSLKRGVKYTISTKDKVQKVFILLREATGLKILYTHDCYTNGTTFVASEDMVCQVTVTFKESSTFNNTQIAPQIEVGEKTTEYEPYQDGGTVHIDSSTEFPLLGLKSFDGETNIISPGNVEVTYAKSDSGSAILDTLENKLDKDNVVNNQTTTEAGFALDARQANPNIDGSLAKQISDLNGSLLKFQRFTVTTTEVAVNSDSYIKLLFPQSYKELIALIPIIIRPRSHWDSRGVFWNFDGSQINFRVIGLESASAQTFDVEYYWVYR